MKVQASTKASTKAKIISGKGLSDEFVAEYRALSEHHLRHGALEKFSFIINRMGRIIAFMAGDMESKMPKYSLYKYRYNMMAINNCSAIYSTMFTSESPFGNRTFSDFCLSDLQTKGFDPLELVMSTELLIDSITNDHYSRIALRALRMPCDHTLSLAVQEIKETINYPSNLPVEKKDISPSRNVQIFKLYIDIVFAYFGKMTREEMIKDPIVLAIVRIYKKGEVMERLMDRTIVYSVMAPLLELDLVSLQEIMAMINIVMAI